MIKASSCVFVGFLALVACGGESNPDPASPSDVVTAAPPETTSLTYLLRLEGRASTTGASAVEALQAALTDAGYRVVVEPRAPHDAEIACRVVVQDATGGYGSGWNSGAIIRERIYLTATVTSRGRVIDEAAVDFIAANVQITTRHLRPAVKSFNTSEKIAQLGREIRDEAAAHEKEPEPH